MVAGREASPGDAKSTERLKTYWAEGPGAAKIQWSTPGDFDRCIALVQTAIAKGGNAPLEDNEIKGFCASLHKRATGFTPGHAPGERITHT